MHDVTQPEGLAQAAWLELVEEIDRYGVPVVVCEAPGAFALVEMIGHTTLPDVETVLAAIREE